MSKRQLQIVVLGALILFEGVAAAASISTRVRVLESKVSKQDKTVKQVSRSQAEQQQQFEQGMNRVYLLERKVKSLDKQIERHKESKDKINQGAEDKRYTYP